MQELLDAVATDLKWSAKDKAAYATLAPPLLSDMAPEPRSVAPSRTVTLCARSA